VHLMALRTALADTVRSHLFLRRVSFSSSCWTTYRQAGTHRVPRGRRHSIDLRYAVRESASEVVTRAVGRRSARRPRPRGAAI
jgi:hypothetical protein